MSEDGSPRGDGSTSPHQGHPLGGRDSFASYHSYHEAVGIGANVLTLKAAKVCGSSEGAELPRPLDAASGGLALHTLSVSGNVPELGSPTTTAESSVRTPPLSATQLDTLKSGLSPHALASVPSAEVSSAEHSAASEDELLAFSPARFPPNKDDSTSSVKADDAPSLPSTTPSKSSAPLQPAGIASPRLPPLEKKTSTIGKLLSHRDRSQSAVVGAHGVSHSSTANLATRPPNLSKSNAVPRSPAMPQSGDESDGGHNSDTSTSSATSALRSLGRRLSSKKDVAIAKSIADDLIASKSEKRVLDRNAHEGGLSAPMVDERTGKMERKRSTKAEVGDKQEHMTLKEYVAAHAGKMTRKSSTTSRKSDDDRSDDGASASGRTRAGSAAGAATTASLLKKYGVCEKVAIGKGATAVVRLAHKWDRSTERLYAVKEFRKRRKNETEREYVKKLTSEFCISSTLHHAHVVETVDLVQDENHHWCEVMEYCPGGDLYAAIKKGDMNNKEIYSYFKQTVLGIAYLHSMGVAHRDIKPENLLLDARGYVKITDFGVSDVFRMCWEKVTHLSKGLCGSEPYIAPEQFEQKEYDARLVDVWACAIVFYCMVAQELPWRAARLSDPTFAAYVDRYSQPSPAPLHTIHPRECRQLIKRMLDPNPKSRHMIENVAEDPWLAAVEIIETTPPGHSASAPP